MVLGKRLWARVLGKSLDDPDNLRPRTDAPEKREPMPPTNPAPTIEIDKAGLQQQERIERPTPRIGFAF